MDLYNHLISTLGIMIFMDLVILFSTEIKIERSR